nr:RecName: Full=60 kDa cell wall protein [Arabidopsis thaliana]
KGVNDGT